MQQAGARTAPLIRDESEDGIQDVVSDGRPREAAGERVDRGPARRAADLLWERVPADARDVSGESSREAIGRARGRGVVC